MLLRSHPIRASALPRTESEAGSPSTRPQVAPPDERAAGRLLAAGGPEGRRDRSAGGERRLGGQVGVHTGRHTPAPQRARWGAIELTHAKTSRHARNATTGTQRQGGGSLWRVGCCGHGHGWCEPTRCHSIASASSFPSSSRLPAATRHASLQQAATLLLLLAKAIATRYALVLSPVTCHLRGPINAIKLSIGMAWLIQHIHPLGSAAGSQ
eukprot:scaffold32_cov120-Isochrysis_galbana.AAC.4